MTKLFIISLLLCLQVTGQVKIIGSKSYIRSAGVTNNTSYVTFSPGGYADYILKAPIAGVYKFTVQVINNAAKSSYLYIWSPAAQSWSNAAMSASTTYQPISTSVTLDTTASYVRLYFPDSAAVDNLNYYLDTTTVTYRLSALEQKIANIQAQLITILIPPALNLQPFTDKLNTIQRSIDSIGTLYVVPGYGTSANPIKP